MELWAFRMYLTTEEKIQIVCMTLNPTTPVAERYHNKRVRSILH